jgi:hypothetical protein
MKVRDLDGSVVGKRIVVTGVEWSRTEELGYVDDSSRLIGQTGIAEKLHPYQLWVRWDNPEPGGLMLTGEDEVELV